MVQKGYINELDRTTLRELSLTKDKKFDEAWDNYLDNKDENEFVITMRVLCSNFRSKKQNN